MKEHRLAQELGWKFGEDYPEWGNNDLYLTTIRGGYLQDGETPREGYRRLATTAALLLKDESLEDRFFNIFWKGYLVPATPVMANLGTDAGLPISCFSGRLEDDMYEIGRKELEMRMLSKYGGGTAYDFSEVRSIGSPIKNGRGGTSDGIIPFMKSYDSTIVSSKQSKVRRGAVALYLNIEHDEFLDFLDVRTPKGDIDRQCHNIHQGAVIEDAFMQKVVDGDDVARNKWLTLLKTRVKTGEPYLFFKTTANRLAPTGFKENDLVIHHSNLCNEINLCTDYNHTLVCCLSSLNALLYDEWKDTDTVELSIMFLDAVIEEFINKSKNLKGIEDATRFALKSRALGLGMLGWHSYLQSKNIPFISVAANSLTRQIFKNIRTSANEASEKLALKYGEPEWCKGTGRRNLTLMAVAPNRSSSKLAGGLSQGIEPIAANFYIDDDAKGLHIRKNVYLDNLIKAKDVDYDITWNKIIANKGSIQQLDEFSKDEKEVFATFKEINQLELVRQAAIRQEYIDQGQSINVAFHQDAPASFINKVHLEAWKLGLKGLYYFRSESSLSADNGQRDLYSECLMCEG